MAARYLLRLAERETAGAGTAFAGTRHLLVAMVEQAVAIAARVRARVVPGARRLRRAVALVWDPGSDAACGRQESSIFVWRRVAAARGEAGRPGSPAIEPEHLLLAPLAGERGTACGLPEALGLRLERARSLVLRASTAASLEPDA